MAHIQHTKIGRKGLITLNRPEKRNALSLEIVSELTEAFKLLEADDEVKLIILKASGSTFCSGADLGYLQKLQEFTIEENINDSKYLKDLFLMIYYLKKVVIAQVQGHAIAGGCGLASVCDFVYAVPEASFGYTEVRIGFIPAIVMSFLTRRIGEGHARQLLLSGELIRADEALRIGLISRIVAAQELDNSVNAFADYLIRSNSSEAMTTTKKMMGQIGSMTLEEGLDLGVKMNAQARSSADCKRGIGSFLRKEEISW